MEVLHIRCLNMTRQGLEITYYELPFQTISKMWLDVTNIFWLRDILEIRSQSPEDLAGLSLMARVGLLRLSQ